MKLILFALVTTNLSASGASRPKGESSVEEAKLLARAISNWRKGMQLPEALLSYPNGPSVQGECGIGRTSAATFIARIDNLDLLEALIRHPQTDAESLRAAVARFLQLKDLRALSCLLDDEGHKGSRRVSDARAKGYATAALTTNQAELLQMVNSQFARLKVAWIDFDEMESSSAFAVLSEMKRELDVSADWGGALSRQTKAHPNKKTGGTLVGYLFDGWITENGFDLERRSLVSEIRGEHLRKVFESPPGNYVLVATKSVFLFHLQDKVRGCDQEGAKPRR